VGSKPRTGRGSDKTRAATARLVGYAQEKSRLDLSASLLAAVNQHHHLRKCLSPAPAGLLLSSIPSLLAPRSPSRVLLRFFGNLRRSVHLRKASSSVFLRSESAFSSTHSVHRPHHARSPSSLFSISCFDLQRTATTAPFVRPPMIRTSLPCPSLFPLPPPPLPRRSHASVPPRLHRSSSISLFVVLDLRCRTFFFGSALAGDNRKNVPRATHARRWTPTPRPRDARVPRMRRAPLAFLGGLGLESPVLFVGMAPPPCALSTGVILHVCIHTVSCACMHAYCEGIL